MSSSKPIVVVTGAGGGIGSQLVDHLLTNGTYRVCCQYRNNNEELMKVLEKYPTSVASCYKIELTEERKIAEFCFQMNESFGKPFAIINLAGASSNAMSWKMTEKQFQSVIDDNLLSTFLMCKHFIPAMRDAGYGRIINASSVIASTGAVGASHYCAAKAGIEGFTRAIALELVNKNVTANAIGLGYFDTGLINTIPPQIQEQIKANTPMKRFGKVNELGGLVDFLLSPASSFVTGQTYHINGGFYL